MLLDIKKFKNKLVSSTESKIFIGINISLEILLNINIYLFETYIELILLNGIETSSYLECIYKVVFDIFKDNESKSIFFSLRCFENIR